MIVTKKAISRRTVLRGIGVAVSLPLLDAMIPALTAARRRRRNPCAGWRRVSPERRGVRELAAEGHRRRL